MTIRTPWRARMARAWPVAKYVIGLALAALVFDQLSDEKGELAGATRALSHLHWGWVLLGVVAEAGSFLALVNVQRRLLLAGQVDVAIGPMAAITLAANSITNSVPAGSVIATVFSFRQFRRRGADEAVAGWSVVATIVVASVTLAVVAAIGAVVAGADGASLDVLGVIVAVLLATLAMGAVFVQERALVWAVSATVRLCRRLTGWPRGELAAHIDRIILRLTAVRLSPGQVAGVLWWGWANWMFDCSCLAMSFLAVGAGVPWKGLLLAYGAGQLAANLPITPGGLGVVEGSLTISIVAYGGAESSTVLAVLLYRLLSFWLALPVGWGTWAWLAWTGRGRRWSVPVLAGAAGTVGTTAAAGTAGTAGAARTIGTVATSATSATVDTPGTATAAGTVGAIEAVGTADTVGTSGAIGTAGTAAAAGTAGTAATAEAAGTTATADAGDTGATGTAATAEAAGTTATADAGDTGATETAATADATGSAGTTGTARTVGTAGAVGTADTVGTAGIPATGGAPAAGGLPGGDGDAPRAVG